MALEPSLTRCTSWRRKELAQIVLFAKQAEPSAFHEPLLRASVSIVYANWEGAAKECARAYIEHVKQQYLPFSALKPCFLALVIKRRGKQLANSEGISPFLELVGDLERCGPYFSQKWAAEEIRSDSNLSSSTLTEIFRCLGITPSQRWAMRRNFIDADLLRLRNSIAHGGREPVEPAQLIEIARLVDEMIGWLGDELLAAAEQELYLRQPASLRAPA